MDYEMRSTQYQDFGGVKFPTLVHVHQGDPRLNPAHNYYELKVTSVKANVAVPTMRVPDAVRQATAPPVNVECQKLAAGVWLHMWPSVTTMRPLVRRRRRAHRAVQWGDPRALWWARR